VLLQILLEECSFISLPKAIRIFSHVLPSYLREHFSELVEVLLIFLQPLLDFFTRVLELRDSFLRRLDLRRLLKLLLEGASTDLLL